MNVCIQCLANTVQVKEFFLDGEAWKSHVNIKSRKSKPELLVDSFAKLIEQLWTSNELFVKPFVFKEIACYINAYFKGQRQHDAQEFLLFLINELSEGTNLSLSEPSLNVKWSPKKQLLDIAIEFWSLYMAGNWSLFSWLFSGLSISELKCKNCNRWSWTLEPFIDLPLAVTTIEEITLNLILVPLILNGPEFRLITLVVKKTDTIGLIIEMLYELEDTGFRPKSENIELVISILAYGRVMQLLHHSLQVGKLESVSKSKSLYVYETVIKNAKEIIEEDKEEDKEDEYKADKYVSFSEPSKRPDSELYDYFTHVSDRTIFHRESYIWKRYDVNNCGNPTVVLLNTFISGYELYEHVWQSITRYLKPSSKYLIDPKACWWRTYTFQTTDKRPFILRKIDSLTNTCSACHWSKHCLGCSILPNEDRIGYLNSISIDWYWDVYKEDYMSAIIVKGYEEIKKEKPVSLYELLKKFTTKEVVTNMKCEVIDEVSEHVKKLSILKLPIILILYLKRYNEEYFYFYH